MQVKTTCNLELIAVVKDLATVVDTLAMKVHSFQTYHAKIEVGMEFLCTTLLCVEENTNKITSAKNVENVTMPIAISDEEEASPVSGSRKGCSSKKSKCSKSLSGRPSRRYGDDLWSLVITVSISDSATRKTIILSAVSHKSAINLTTTHGLHLSSNSLSPTLSGVNLIGNMEVAEMPPPLLIGQPRMMLHQSSFSPPGYLRWICNNLSPCREELVKFGDFILIREELLSLIPGANLLMCTTIIFDIRQEKSVKQLVIDYSKTWMKPSITLNYVYLPIKEDFRYWYLIVIAFKEGMLYYLNA
ncbi:uncharacterized protein DS421_4g126080 [Arachis hypogaea]|nr:uncharacterized protein DS421_4g126080 [Arachis hypogaea]